MQFGLTREELISQSTFDLETQLVFSKHWICIGRVEEHVADFEQACFFRTVQIGDYELIVVSTKQREFRAFHNICRHRGTRLLDETSGVLPNSCMTCPYHAWTYDVEGQLIGAPNMGGFEEFRRQEFGLQEVACVDWGGFLFVHLSAPKSAFATDFAAIMTRLRDWQLDDLQLVSRIDYAVEANWKMLFQNYSECYHCPTVHPSLNRLTPYRSATNDLEEGPILGGPMQLSEGCETVSVDGLKIAEPMGSLNEQQKREVYYYTVFPNCFFSAHPDYVMVHSLERLTTSRTAVHCYFLMERGYELNSIERAMRQWDEINRQDWRVCELTQRGVQSPAYQPGPYSPLESMVAAFDRHYRRVMRS